MIFCEKTKLAIALHSQTQVPEGCFLTSSVGLQKMTFGGLPFLENKFNQVEGHWKGGYSD